MFVELRELLYSGAIRRHQSGPQYAFDLYDKSDRLCRAPKGLAEPV